MAKRYIITEEDDTYEGLGKLIIIVIIIGAPIVICLMIYDAIKYALEDATVTSTTQIYRDCSDPDKACSLKYDNKKLEVTGIISKITNDAVEFESFKSPKKNEKVTIKCFFGDPQEFAELTKGQTITVIGRGTFKTDNYSDIHDYPDITGCELKKNENKTTQSHAHNNIKAPEIPELIPEPSVTMTPEERLTFQKTIKTKKGAREYLIFQDAQLDTPCYIAVHNDNIQAQDENRYCIPFSGNEKDLTHPIAVTKTASQYENYIYCAAIMKPEKNNIPGIAGFLKAFNPTYYAANLEKLINDPLNVHKPNDSKTDFSYFYPNSNGDCSGDNHGPSVSNPFITLDEYKKHNLAQGFIFPTVSSTKGNRSFHQYWEVTGSTAETICECGADGCHDYEDNIIQIKALNSKETYQALMPQILDGMPARDQYCKAVNQTFINEARTEKWARVDNNSPLMNK